MNLFRPKKLTLIRRLSSRLRAFEWRSEQSLVTQAREIFNNPQFQAMLDVVKNESPHNFAYGGVTLDERAVIQARIEGYQLCINNLESLGSFQKPKEEIEPTYEGQEQVDR